MSGRWLVLGLLSALFSSCVPVGPLEGTFDFQLIPPGEGAEQWRMGEPVRSRAHNLPLRSPIELPVTLLREPRVGETPGAVPISGWVFLDHLAEPSRISLPVTNGALNARLVPGRYALEGRPSGALEQARYAPIRVAEVLLADTSAPIELRFPAGVPLEGVARQLDGTLLGDVLVSVRALDEDGVPGPAAQFTRTGRTVEGTNPDIDGRFSLDLAPGRYLFDLDGGDSDDAPPAVTLGPIIVPDDTQGGLELIFPALTSHAVVGRVTRVDEAPVAEVRVCAEADLEPSIVPPWPGGRIRRCTVSDAAGSWTLSLPAAVYDFSLRPSPESSQEPRTTVAAITSPTDLPIVLPERPAMGGLVQGPDCRPLAGARVQLIGEGEGPLYSFSTLTDEKGLWSARPVTGDYRLSVHPPGTNGLDALAAHRSVTIGAADTRIDVVLSQGEAIEGITGFAIDGEIEGRAGVWVRALDPVTGDLLDETLSGARGLYRLVLPLRSRPVSPCSG